MRDTLGEQLLGDMIEGMYRMGQQSSGHVTPEIFENGSTFRDWIVKTRQQAAMFALKRQQDGQKYTANHLKEVVTQLDYALWADQEQR